MIGVPLSFSESKSWINLSIFSLSLAAIYAIITIFLTSIHCFFEDEIYKNLYNNFSIVHMILFSYVNLFCIANAIITYSVKDKFLFINKLLRYICFISICILVISSILESDNAIINNSMPIIDNLAFIIGISFFTVTCFFISFLSLFSQFSGSIIDYTSKTLAIIVVTSFTCLLIACHKLSHLIYDYPIDLIYYYKMIFLGYSNILQFLYFVVMEFFCIVFLYKALSQIKLVYKIMILFNGAFVIFTPIVYFLYQIDDFYLYNFFTKYLIYIGYVSILSIFILLLFDIFQKKIDCSNLSIITFLSLSLLFFFKNTNISKYYYVFFILIPTLMIISLYVVWNHKKEIIVKKKNILYWITTIIVIIVAKIFSKDFMDNEITIEILGNFIEIIALLIFIFYIKNINLNKPIIGHFIVDGI